MSGLGRVVVGYRHTDPRRWKLDQSIREAGRCIAGCGFGVWFVPSGQSAVRDRDAQPICDDCYQLYKDEVQAEL